MFLASAFSFLVSPIGRWIVIALAGLTAIGVWQFNIKREAKAEVRQEIEQKVTERVTKQNKKASDAKNNVRTRSNSDSKWLRDTDDGYRRN